jgi:hypothetical protein
MLQQSCATEVVPQTKAAPLVDAALLIKPSPFAPFEYTVYEAFCGEHESHLHRQGLGLIKMCSVSIHISTRNV